MIAQQIGFCLKYDRLTKRIWLRAFGTPHKFLASLGTSDTLGTLAEIIKPKNDKNISS
jgi:hypothetical protein